MLRADPGEEAARADTLRLEQSIELPRAAIRPEIESDGLLPSIHAIERLSEERIRVSLGFPLDLIGDCPAQFLNLLFGNSSLLEDVVLETIRLPDALDELFPGPRFGIAGWRALTNRSRGALAATALKTVGLGPEECAALCATFARAGLDLIKDDHGLANQACCPFAPRLRACLSAVSAVADETGHEALYVPNLIGTPESIAHQLELCHELGVRAVMTTPFLCGLPFFHELVARAEMPVMAHPALGGLRVAPRTLLGTLLRIFGADAVIFPHHGGRFAFSIEACHEIGEQLRHCNTTRRPALPVPAGGMDATRVGELVAFYGSDVMLLIGGSLYLAGDDLLEKSRAFVREAHGENS